MVNNSNFHFSFQSEAFTSKKENKFQYLASDNNLANVFSKYYNFNKYRKY